MFQLVDVNVIVAGDTVAFVVSDEEILRTTLEAGATVSDTAMLPGAPPSVIEIAGVWFISGLSVAKVKNCPLSRSILEAVQVVPLRVRGISIAPEEKLLLLS